jgi:hypothetical protein
MREKLNKFLDLTGWNKLLLVEATLFQLLTGIILKLVPFRVIPRLFALPSRLTSHVSPLTSHLSHLKAIEIKKAILTTSRLSPWKNKCLVQSLAARWMLNLRSIPSRLSLGVTLQEDNKMIAHSWLKAGDFEVVEKSGNYSELYLF